MKRIKKESKGTLQEKKQIEIFRQKQECLSALWALEPNLLSRLSVSDVIFRKYNLLAVREKIKILNIVYQEYVGKQRIELEREVWGMTWTTIRHIYATNDLSGFDSYVFLSDDRKRNTIESFCVLIESVPHIQSMISYDKYKTFINCGFNIYRINDMKSGDIKVKLIQMNLPTDFFFELNKSFVKKTELQNLFLTYPRLDKQFGQAVLTIKYWFWQQEQIILKKAEFFAIEDIVAEMLSHVYPSQESILSVALVCKKFYQLVKNMHYELPKAITCDECKFDLYERTIDAKCFTCANHLPIMFECLDKILSNTPIRTLPPKMFSSPFMHFPESMYGMIDMLSLRDLAKLSFLNKFFYAKCRYITFRSALWIHKRCSEKGCSNGFNVRDISVGNYGRRKCIICESKNSRGKLVKCFYCGAYFSGPLYPDQKIPHCFNCPARDVTIRTNRY